MSTGLELKKENILLSLSIVADAVLLDGFNKEAEIKDRCLSFFKDPDNHRLVCRHFKNEESVLQYDSASWSLSRSSGLAGFGPAANDKIQADQREFELRKLKAKEDLEASRLEFEKHKEQSSALVQKFSREIKMQRYLDVHKLRLIGYLADQVNLGNKKAIADLSNSSPSEIQKKISDSVEKNGFEKIYGEVAIDRDPSAKEREQANQNISFLISNRKEMSFLKPSKRSMASFLERQPPDFGETSFGKSFKDVGRIEASLAQKAASLEKDKPKALSRFGESGFGRFVSRVMTGGKSEEWLHRRNEVANEGLETRAGALITTIETLSADRVREFYRESLENVSFQSIYDDSASRARSFEKLNLNSIDEIRNAIQVGRADITISMGASKPHFSWMSAVASAQRLSQSIEGQRTLNVNRDRDVLSKINLKDQENDRELEREVQKKSHDGRQRRTLSMER